MTKLMECHDQKQGEILEDVPSNRRVTSVMALDFICRHQKPGPMQEHIDPFDLEQANRSLAAGGHVEFIIQCRARR